MKARFISIASSGCSRCSSGRLTGVRSAGFSFLFFIVFCGSACAADRNGPASAPASRPVGKLPHLQIDVQAKEIRVECEALNVDMPLEFFCVASGTNEHES